MSQYYIRVVLKDNASRADYIKLAKCLASKGIVDVVMTTKGTKKKLPYAEYAIDSYESEQAIMDKVNACARSVSDDFSVVVLTYSSMLMHNLDDA